MNYSCKDCDKMNTRLAVLTLLLRKLAVETHVSAKHEGKVEKCQAPYCKRIMTAIANAGWKDDDVVVR